MSQQSVVQKITAIVTMVGFLLSQIGASQVYAAEPAELNLTGQASRPTTTTSSSTLTNERTPVTDPSPKPTTVDPVLDQQAGSSTLSVGQTKQPPQPPSGLKQLRSTGKELLAGDPTNEQVVFFQALLTDPDPTDNLALAVEIRAAGEAFTDQATATSQLVSFSGQPVSATVPAAISREGNYQWQAWAVDQAGQRSVVVAFPETATQAVHDFGIDLTLPDPPTGVSAQSVGTSSVLVTWQDSLSQDVVAYELWRSLTASNPGQLIATLALGIGRYQDTGLKSSTTYVYHLVARDRASNLSQPSFPGATVTETLVDSTTPPPGFSSTGFSEVPNTEGIDGVILVAPKGSNAIATYVPTINEAADYEIFVSWVVSPAGVDGAQSTDAPYRVKTKQVEQHFIVDQTKLANGSSPESTNRFSGWLQLGTFQLEAGTTNLVELRSSQAGFIVADASRFVYLRPARVEGLAAIDHPDDQGGVVDLSWQASTSKTVVEYRLYRSEKSGQYDFSQPLIKTTTTQATDSNAKLKTTYYYVVRAFDGTRESPPSLEATAQSLDNLAPNPPTDFKVEFLEIEARLNWSMVDGAVGYLVRYRKTGAADYTQVFIEGRQSTETTVSGLEADTDYEFGVASRDAGGNESSFVQKSGKTQAKPEPTPVKQIVAVPVAQAAEAPRPVIPRPVVTPTPSPTVESPSPTEIGTVKGEEETRPQDRRRAVIAVVVLIIAVAAGIAGYYGYEELQRRSQQQTLVFPEEKPTEKPPRKETKKRGRPGRW